MLYGIGAVIAIPCIKAESFAGFCISIFIIGNGLGSLETAANPYITVCGPPRYSEMRINLSQAFNGIGTVVAPLMGSYVFFNFGDDEEGDNKALENVQWVYLAIALFVWILAVIFWISPIPEITDADTAHQAEETDAGFDDKPFIKQHRLFHAAIAQFCYTGAQVGIASFFINYAVETRPNTSSAMGAQLFAGAQGAFALGRFVGVGVMHYVKPRIVFLVFMTACFVFIAPAVVHTGNVGIALLYLVLFFESICFPTIVALGMRGLGRHSKRGSGYIVAGVCGGAVVPPILGATADARDMGLAMVVPLCFFVVAWTYSLAVNFAPRYKTVVDAFHVTEVGVAMDAAHAEKAKTSTEEVQTKTDSPAAQ